MTISLMMFFLSKANLEIEPIGKQVKLNSNTDTTQNQALWETILLILLQKHLLSRVRAFLHSSRYLYHRESTWTQNPTYLCVEKLVFFNL